MTENTDCTQAEELSNTECVEEIKAEAAVPKKNNSLCLVVVVILAIALLLESIVLIRLTGLDAADSAAKEAVKTDIETIDRTSFDELCAKGESFIVLFGRVSCKQCAVVEYVLDGVTDSPIPIYKFDMEKYYGTDEYDAIKNEVGINYVPTLFYYEDGKQKYCKNNPLPDGYYDSEQTAEGRHALRVTTRENIEAFINGAIGKGEVINEIPTSDTLVAKEVPAEVVTGE